MSKIVWLASYPKSGNTWLRAFLTNFQDDAGRTIDINALAFGTRLNDRAWFDDALGLESSDMTDQEIEDHRPAVCRYFANQSPGTLYIKTHDAYTLTTRGEPLIPSDVTQGAIYVTRDPLDVAVSFAHHLNENIEVTIRRLASETATLSRSNRGLKGQLRERLLSWSGHVLSWLDQCAIPVHVIRYEDMACRPIETFAAAVRFLGWVEDCDRLRRAVANSSFEVLRQQEQVHGFRERYPEAASFFRRGQTGAWREVLTKEQEARIVRDHGLVMGRVGYLPHNADS